MQDQNIFSAIDISVSFFWIILMWLSSIYIRRRWTIPSVDAYFFYAWAFKLIMAFGFVLVYVIIQSGGDTIAYWSGAECLNDLLFTNPAAYWHEMTLFQSGHHVSPYFTSETGMPPGWIYREIEAWNVSKILSIFSVLTFKSYLATSIILASISFFVSWILVSGLTKIQVFGPKTLAFAFLFFPSVAFWSSGISKDGFVYILTLSIIGLFFLLVQNVRVVFSWKAILLLLCFVFLFEIRPFIVFALLIPMTLAFSTRFINNLKDKSILRFLARFLIFTVGVFMAYLLLNSSYTQSLLDEAQLTQADFNNNPIYTGLKYEIFQADNSIFSFLLVFPQALFIGLFRPFITESLNVNFIINGIESTILIYYLFTFIFNKNLGKNLGVIKKSEFAIFALLFFVIVGFMAGYTSILFGVLVRIRSIALPFLFLILSIRPRPNFTTVN